MQAMREDFLLELRSELDSSTFAATIDLMLQEARAAIGRQRALIALERLARRSTTIALNKLRALEEIQATLMAALLPPDDPVAAMVYAGASTVVPLRVADR